MIKEWKVYAPSQSMPWNIDRVKHLHRRAAFGATWSELQRDLQSGPEAAIERLLRGKPRSDGQREDFESIASVIGDAAAHSDDENRLKAWWLFRMLFTPDPLREKLTLSWHNHFATSNLKVNDLQLMRQQNELLRQHATGRFGKLLAAIVHDPAMLVWLDANSNRRGHPNENLARELMELFTLGSGNFGEEDVKQAAKALSGWSIKSGAIQYREEHHDASDKAILGEMFNFDVDSLSVLLLKQEATSHRIAWRLCDLLMGEGAVSADATDELARGLRERQLDVSWAVETILRSELFFAHKNIGSRVSSPVEYALSTVRALEMLDKPPSTLVLAEWCTQLGQDLFRPPNVGGWSGGRNWLNSRTVVGRFNFAAALVAGEMQSPVQPPDLSKLVERLTSESKLGPTEALATLLLSNASRTSAGTEESVSQLVVQLLTDPQAFLT